ncbi:MAG TPA: hypothetical protein VHK91_06390 [Flavisolibacter sp.]|jgi:hypothetical protein|nr:hypothetical protein [Flavisolibacter sp.]
MDPDELIPDQKTGLSTNTESIAAFPDEKQASEFYKIARDRLLDVNRWQDWAGTATAQFILTDSSGKEVNRSARKGDHFKIDIPGPGSLSGEGFDWVRIEAIETSESDSLFTAIQVRPATNPLNERKDVAHFFSDEATSSFIVRLIDCQVIAGVYGRNEKPNVKAETLLDKARHTAIATGAVSGLSKLQWKSLVNGLVKI